MCAKLRSRRVVMAAAAALAMQSMAVSARADLAYLNPFALLSASFVPIYVGTGPSGQVVVADSVDGKSNVYAADGTLQFPLSTTGKTTFGSPTFPIEGPDGNFYIPDSQRNAILVFNSLGQETREIGPLANLFFIQGVAASSNGTLYATSGTGTSGNNDVEVYSSAGQFLYNFSGQSGVATGLKSGEGIALDSTASNVFVADDAGNVLDVFSPNGNFEYTIGSASGPGQLKNPFSLAVSATNLIYVADQNSGVKVFTENGTYLQTVALTANGQSIKSVNVTVGPTGMVYVIPQNVSGVYRYFDPASWGSGTNSFTNAATGPTSVAVGSGGLLGSTLTLDATKGLIVGGATTVNNGGVLNVTGGSLNTGSLIVDGATNGASFTLTSGSLTTPSLSVINGGVADLAGSGLAFTFSGAVGVSGASSQFKVDQGAIVSATGLTNTGQVIAGNTADFIVYNSVTNGGTVNLAGGELDVRGTLTNLQTNTIQGFGTLSTTGGLVNSGTLAFAGSSSVSGSVANTGQIHLSGTTPNVFFGPVNNGGTLTVDAGANGTLYGAYSGAGAIVNNGSLYVNANSVAGSVSGGGTLTVGSATIPASLMISPSAGTVSQGALVINPGSTFDLTKGNTLLIKFTTDPVATLRGYLNTGYHGGDWKGTGLTSSSVAAQAAAVKGTSKGSYSIGYIDGNTDGAVAASNGVGLNQILIRPTLVADANLDGKVDFSDLLAMAQNVGSLSADWAHADFNFDGKVDFNDLLLLAQNINQTNGTTTLSGELPASFEAQWALAQAEVKAAGGSGAVPEPGAVGLVIAAGAGLLARRRRDA